MPGNTIGTAYVQILPSADGIKGKLTEALGGEAEKAGGSLGGKLGNAMKTGLKVAGAAIAAAATGVTAFAGASVQAGAKFDSAMSQVAATMGTTVDQIGDLRTFAQDMGAKTAFSATQAAEALNYMALAGYDSKTSMDMLPNVLNLAAAGSIELASASDMITDAQSALGLSLEDTSVMVDQMAAASSKSNTSVAQLGEAFLTIGATARSMKGGTQELSTVLGVLADNGIKGAEGGTHLRNVIQSLTTESKPGKEALKKLGMSYKDMYDKSGNLRSIPEIMQQISGKMEGMTQQSKDAIISGLFNKGDLAAVNALLGTTGERWDELSAAIGDSAGAAEAMADTQLDNLQGDVTLFKSALEGAQISISDVLTPSLREFVQFGTDGLGKITDAFNEGGLDAAVDAFSEVITEGVSKITEKLPVVLEAGTKILQAIGDGILQNLPLLATTAIDIMIQLTLGIIQAIPQLISAIPEVIMALINGIISNLPQLITAGKEILSAIADGLVQSLPEIIPAVVDLIMQIVTALTDPGMLTTLTSAAIAIMFALANGLIEAIPVLIEALPTIVGNLVQVLIQNAPRMLAAGLVLIGQLVVGVTMALAEGLLTIVAKFAEWVSTAGDKTKEFGEAIHNGFMAFVSEVGGWINDNIIQPAKDAIARVTDIGQEIVDKIKEGINNAWSGLTSWFDGIWNSLFGNRNVKVNVNAGGNVGGAQGFATGLDYVPYDEFPAILHKGEAVLTAEEADVWRNGGGGGMTINQYIQSVPQTPVQLASATAASFELARWAV